MRISIIIILSLFFYIQEAAPQDRDIAADPFLKPYVEQLKKETSSENIDRIRTMAESELILLHHGYGTAIRNKWLHGDRDKELLTFFHNKGIKHPDKMSMIIIYALWHELNRNLSPEQSASIKNKRELVARKRLTYETLESECEKYLEETQKEFELCYERYGLPSKNPLGREPFYKIEVNKSGGIKNIIYFQGATPEVKQCLKQHIEKFKFSSFNDDDTITIYIIGFPRCRVLERDSLHQ